MCGRCVINYFGLLYVANLFGGKNSDQRNIFSLVDIYVNILK